MTKLVYIGGYGRSGSTLLEYLLTQQPTVVACGEVERHLRRFGKRKICTCGRRLKTVPGVGIVPAPIREARGLEPRAAYLGAARSRLPRLCGDGRFLEDRLGLAAHAVPSAQSPRARFPAGPSRARPARRFLVDDARARAEAAERIPAKFAGGRQGLARGDRLDRGKSRLRGVRPAASGELSQASLRGPQPRSAPVDRRDRAAPRACSQWSSIAASRSTIATSSTATPCASRRYRRPTSRKTWRGRRRCPKLTARWSGRSPGRSAGATITARSGQLGTCAGPIG